MYMSIAEGTTSDNWYRSDNGYEYLYISNPANYNAATTACKTQDSTSTLAAAAVRDQTLTRFLKTTTL